MTRIEDSPAFCPICLKLRANDKEVEECMEKHTNDKVDSAGFTKEENKELEERYKKMSF